MNDGNYCNLKTNMAEIVNESIPQKAHSHVLFSYRQKFYLLPQTSRQPENASGLGN